MQCREVPLEFLCNGDALYGILHHPEAPSRRGVLILVGGPQYRTGSHRQFVLLARYLASAGVPVLRFDYRGMGDSEGDERSFEDIDADIGAAVDSFYAQVDVLEELVIWGLCDAASAVSFYAHTDYRVTGLVLANPWVRTEKGLAKARIKYYYLRRFVAADFWRKIGRGQFDYSKSIHALFRTVGSIIRPIGLGRDSLMEERNTPGKTLEDGVSLPERMATSLRCFEGPILLILSGRDLTASEFKDAISASNVWKEIMNSPRVVRRDLPEVDHTFSRRQWRDQVAAWTLEWLHSW